MEARYSPIGGGHVESLDPPHSPGNTRHSISPRLGSFSTIDESPVFLFSDEITAAEYIETTQSEEGDGHSGRVKRAGEKVRKFVGSVILKM